MEPQPNELKAIRILYLALLIGQIIFAVIVTVLNESGILSIKNDSLVLPLQVIVLLFAAGGIAASIFLFRKKLSDINPEDELSKKLEKYRAALILRFALCEMPTLFAIIAYFITHNRSFLWITILLIVNFISLYPSGRKIAGQLQLSSSEQSALGIV